MSRKSGAKIETWQHPKYTSETAEIRLHRQDGLFMAEYGDGNYSNKSLEELRAELTAAVEARMKLDWIPVIIVELRGNADFVGKRYRDDLPLDEYDLEQQRKADATSAELKVSASRAWFAKLPDGRWLECSLWHSEDYKGSDRFDSKTSERLGTDAPMPRRLNAKEFSWSGKVPFAIPCSIEGTAHWEVGEKTHYIHYTEELWAALNEVSRRTQELKRKLDALVGSDDGQKVLIANLQRLLPPGDK
jgi:hypothetical protein